MSIGAGLADAFISRLNEEFSISSLIRLYHIDEFAELLKSSERSGEQLGDFDMTNPGAIPGVAGMTGIGGIAGILGITGIVGIVDVVGIIGVGIAGIVGIVGIVTIGFSFILILGLLLTVIFGMRCPCV